MKQEMTKWQGISWSMNDIHLTTKPQTGHHFRNHTASHMNRNFCWAPTSSSQKMKILPRQRTGDGIDRLPEPSRAFLLNGVLQQFLQCLQQLDHVRRICRYLRFICSIKNVLNIRCCMDLIYRKHKHILVKWYGLPMTVITTTTTTTTTPV